MLALYGLPRPTVHLPASVLILVATLLALVLRLLRPLTGPVQLTLTPSRLRLLSTHHSYRCDLAKREMGYAPVYSTREGLLYTHAHAQAKGTTTSH